MPARIVIVHDDPALTLPLLERFGRDAVLFTNPTTALATLQRAKTVETLICRLQFADRQPIGLSLARLIRKVRPAVQVIFTGDPDYRHHANGLGEFVPEPVSAAYVAMMIEWLGQDDLSAGDPAGP